MSKNKYLEELKNLALAIYDGLEGYLLLMEGLLINLEKKYSA